MNKEAGRGGLLIVMVRLEDGEKLPLVLDTGSPVTILDKSLEPKLGRRLDTDEFWNFGVKQDVGVYAAPKLYLGDVPLRMTGTNIVTFDPKQLSFHTDQTFMGVLGMDVLEHYCFQLDFTAGKIRFLADDKPAKSWGKSFLLTTLDDGCPMISENLVGAKDLSSLIDTGCDYAGWLRPELFQQWTNQASLAQGKIHSPDCVLGGETYRGLDLHGIDSKLLSTDDGHVKYNGIGLRVLAENLVTLDFPNRTMYLKRTSNWPLLDKDMKATATAMAKSALKYLIQLKNKNQLPGSSQNDHGRTTDFHYTHDNSPYLDSGTWDILKKGDPSIYHYTVTRTSKRGPWKLKKAWRTDDGGNVREEYPVP